MFSGFPGVGCGSLGRVGMFLGCRWDSLGGVRSGCLGCLKGGSDTPWADGPGNFLRNIDQLIIILWEIIWGMVLSSNR